MEYAEKYKQLTNREEGRIEVWTGKSRILVLILDPAVPEPNARLQYPDYLSQCPAYPKVMQVECLYLCYSIMLIIPILQTPRKIKTFAQANTSGMEMVCPQFEDGLF